MELCKQFKAIKLRGHNDKYLVADDDQQTVRQSRNGLSQKAKWILELVEGSNHSIRLKSCHGKYLTASDTPFLLGMTGQKVFQTQPDPKPDRSTEWEPIRDGFQVKFRTRDGKYLRANGGPPPWRNSITHDDPHRSKTKDWVLWEVEKVEIFGSEAMSGYLSMAPSFSSCGSDDMLSEPPSPMSNRSAYASPRSVVSHGSSFFDKQARGMELFHNAKAVRLRSHHDKYLIADDDEESVTQDRNGAAKSARWAVEFVDDNVLRLKSCYGKYLTASNHPFLLGMTGRKVLQTRPNRLDSSLEWEPIREGMKVKLKTRYGQFLRANGGLPPWRNSITHDIPHRTATQDWILWEVDIVEIQVRSSDHESGHPVSESQLLRSNSALSVYKSNVPKSDSKDSELKSTSPDHRPSLLKTDSISLESDTPLSISIKSSNYSTEEELMQSRDRPVDSPPKSEGRTIYYHVADEDGTFDESYEGNAFAFKGSGVKELRLVLEEETGLDDILVCTKHPINGKLYPLSLRLPPNNAPMHVVVVQTSHIDE